MSSAWSITARVNPPRTVFVNYPLGRTAGRVGDLAEQTSIVSSALDLLESATGPGDIVPLPLAWPDSWKRVARGRGDTRTERHKTPQWERPDDAAAAGVELEARVAQ